MHTLILKLLVVVERAKRARPRSIEFELEYTVGKNLEILGALYCCQLSRIFWGSPTVDFLGIFGALYCSQLSRVFWGSTTVDFLGIFGALYCSQLSRIFWGSTTE